MKKINSVKRIIFSTLFALAVIVLCNCTVLHASAAEARVRFGSTYYEKNQGDRFPMGIYVENSDGTVAGIGSYHVEISFNSELIEYSEGASSIQRPGLIVLEGTGDGNQNKTMIYFNALYGGSTDVTVTSATVYTTDGTAMTVSFLGSVPVNISGNPPETVTDDDDTDELADGDAEAENDGDETVEEPDDAESINADDETDTSEELSDVDEAADTENVTASEEEANTAESEAVDTVEVTEIPTSEAPVASEAAEGGFFKSLWAQIENDYLKFIIIGIAAIVCIVILIVAIRTAVRVSVHRHKLDKMMKNGSDNQEWAFEFDTIDEDKDIVEDWEYDSSVLDEDWTVNSNTSEVYDSESDSVGVGAEVNEDDSLEDEDFLFEFNAGSDKDN